MHDAPPVTQDAGPAMCERCCALEGQLYLDPALDAGDLHLVHSTGSAVAVSGAGQAAVKHCQLCGPPQLALPFERE